MLISKEQYLEAGVNIGSRRHVKDMEPYIFHVKKNNLAILDLDKTDELIGETAQVLADYEPSDILAVSRKEHGHKAVVQFAEILGADRIHGRFMPGTLTNPNSEEYREPLIVVVTDPEEDYQAVKEAAHSNIPVVAIADSANELEHVDHVIPANNKGSRSIAVIYYLLTREILKARGEIESDEDFDYEIEDFEQEPETDENPRDEDDAAGQ